MSVASAQQIVERIKKAKPSSPIAVFRLTKEERTLVDAASISLKKEKPDRLNAIFGASVTAKKRIEEDPLLVGVYDHRDSPSLVLSKLKRIERRLK